jgi:HlyD family secretion protein
MQRSSSVCARSNPLIQKSEPMLETSRAIRRNLFAALLLVAATGVAVGFSAYTPLDGAVVALGTIVVEGNVKKIQHPTGGVVAEIAVAEGARVEAGDPLIRLDETVMRANLDIVRNNLTTERARLARLQALRDGVVEPVFPPDLAEDASLSGVLEGEARLTRLLLNSQEDQKRGLRERIEQSRQEIKGLKELQKSFSGQRDIVRKDLEDLQPLYKRGNIQRPRISALQRELMRNQGAIGDGFARIAQSRAKIAETELQIVQIDHDFVADIVKQLRETETKITELRERKIAAEDQLTRVDIRSPLSGTVHQLAVHTMGGVVSSSDVLMHIVPSSKRLVVEIQVKPSDIDQLSMGQEARVRFSAFDRRTTDELQGTLTRIAADLTHDPRGRLSYYTATVQVPDSELGRLNGRKLVPGMPAEVLIKAGERTLASYILKPIHDQMERALRER